IKHIYETLRAQNNDAHCVHKTIYCPWGYYTEIDRGKGFLVKRIHVNAGQRLSLQSHNHRHEHWVVVSGIAKVLLDGQEHSLEPGKSIDIPVKAPHSLQNPSKKDIEIIEVQRGDILSEDDIIRYEDIYGRI
ncbi:MAG: phosphomannose isomerase type II C-terminal cupin domain, partial [Alphaproteobacteria bacterium]|nr:phosphomannose isomerase type II C-terminal cupin domain [Alphaproteobacteria bacterium]